VRKQERYFKYISCIKIEVVLLFYSVLYIINLMKPVLFLSVRFLSYFLQEFLPNDKLARRVQIEFINTINEVGVDINRALEFPHSAMLTHFLCGLGPRKANHLMKVCYTLMVEITAKIVLSFIADLPVYVMCLQKSTVLQQAH